MNQFRSFDQLRTNELIIIRNGFFRPSFELSDGQFSYGKLSHSQHVENHNHTGIGTKNMDHKTQGDF
jgi:hypothetical protein